MDYKTKVKTYETISPGTIGISQKISSAYESGKVESDKETSKLVFLARNHVLSCSQNQY